MKYKTLKDILEYPAGTIMEVGGNFARLGNFYQGWDIPLFIIQRNPDWFVELKGGEQLTIMDSQDTTTQETPATEETPVAETPVTETAPEASASEGEVASSEDESTGEGQPA